MFRRGDVKISAKQPPDDINCAATFCVGSALSISALDGCRLLQGCMPTGSDTIRLSDICVQCKAAPSMPKGRGNGAGT